VNRTSVFNLETQLTQKVRSEFVGRGRYKILPDDQGADAVLTGSVLSVVMTPSSFNLDSNLATRFTLTMNVGVELRDVREKKIIWQSSGLLFREEFDVQSGAQLDPAVFFGQDTNAFERITSEFAATIVSAILDAF
jgi:hypothetical protein